jgi:outer membrane protein assembly factor BamB
MYRVGHQLLRVLAASSLLAVSSAGEANWPAWRGADNTGSIEAGDYPASLDPNNVIWKAPLPGKGCSSPIVWNKQIYVTAPTNKMNAAMAFDWSGKLLWLTTLGEENPGRHRNGSGSNPSPVADGELVFVYFKSGNFAALDLNGKIRWQTDLVERYGNDTFYWEHGTSPVLTKHSVLMMRLHHGQSWIAAFDKHTGKLQWKVARNYETPVEDDHSYSTPVIVKRGGAEQLLVWGAEHVTLHDTQSGKQLWASAFEFNPEKKQNWPTVASPIVVNDIAIVAYGRADRNIPRLYGMRFSGPSSPSGAELAWKRDDTGTFVPTPAVYKGKVFILRDRGEMDSIDPQTGKSDWSAAFPKASGNFYASPVIAAGMLYAIREDGSAYVAAIEPTFKLLAENNLGERVIASPAACEGRLLVRGEQNLLCFGQK